MADRVCDSALWHRMLGENRFSGTVPSTISALTALKYLYVPSSLPSHIPRSPALGGAKTPVGLHTSARSGCRDVSGNRLVGRVPPSLLAMPRLEDSLYVRQPLPPSPCVSCRVVDAELARVWMQPLPPRGLPTPAVRPRRPRQGRQRLRRVRGGAGARCAPHPMRVLRAPIELINVLFEYFEYPM